MNMLQIFTAGDQISGFCNGYFGRDDYEDKVCIMVTPRYAVFEYNDSDSEMNGFAVVLNYSENLKNLDKKDWMV